MSQFTPVNLPMEVECETKIKAEPSDEPLPKIEEIAEPDTYVEQEVPIKQEEAVAGNGVTEQANSREMSPKPKDQVTPRKRGHKDAIDSGGTGGDDAKKDCSPTKKKRASPKKPILKVTGRPLPTSYGNASPEDKMLLRMKDEENKSWADIRKAWEDMTGDKVGNSTLSGRYARIKANFVTVHDEDEDRLIRFLKDIEDKFESEKCHRLADAIADAGGARYPPTALQKKHKELTKMMSNISIGGDSE